MEHIDEVQRRALEDELLTEEETAFVADAMVNDAVGRRRSA